MARILLLPAMLILCVSACYGAPCLPGTLASYVGLAGTPCEVGGLQFKDFEIAPGQASATLIDPTLVSVVPGTTLTGAALSLILNDSAGPGELRELFLRFGVLGALGGAAISITGPTATGDGAVIGILDVCPGDSFAGSSPTGCPTSPDSAVVFAIEGDSLLNDGRPFAITSFFDVFVDLTVDGGLGGTAGLEGSSIQFSGSGSGSGDVPEPATLSLAAVGFVFLAISLARRS